ncbi:hypothetical protein ACF0H5_014541 [Mactra antiquata]
MEVIGHVFVLLLMITCSRADHLLAGGIPAPSLLDHLHDVFHGLVEQQNISDNAVSTPVPPPGRMNICDNLCPKWCEKIPGQPRKYTHCHYLCGNLCDMRVIQNNHFIGNPRYEVAPSEYQFDRYDKNGDKFISMEEFSKVEQITIDEALDIFTFADFDADGFIDSDEFKGSPLVFTVQMAEELSNMARTKTTQ